MGDLAEYIGPRDPRWNRKLVAGWVDQDDVARSQTKKVVQIFNPIAPKVIGASAGNHEYRFMLHQSDNVQEWICEGLSVTNLGYSCFVHLVFERENSNEHHLFKGCITHGGSGATTDTGAKNALRKWMTQNDALWYAYGHLHRVGMIDRDELGTNQINKIIDKETIGVLTGCFFRTYQDGVDPSYGEMRTFEPNTIGYSVIEFDINEGSMSFQKKVYKEVD
uniref:Calcineurin-like phosphoesterase n=1 Tax=viral metagenome TaxID=1070528 RepID=A0A6M3L267_9ZZZZ